MTIADNDFYHYILEQILVFLFRPSVNVAFLVALYIMK